MASSLSDILYSILPGLAGIIAICFGLHKSSGAKYIIMLLLLHLLIEMVNIIWFELSLGRNVFLNSIQDLSALSIIIAMMYSFTKRSRITLGIGLAFLSIVTVFIFFIEGFNNYAPIAYSIQEIGVIALCLSYFWYVFNNETNLFIGQNTDFITVCIFLVLNCGSLFTSIMILQITESEDSYGLYDLQLTLDSIANLALIFVLWLVYKRRKRSLKEEKAMIKH